MIMKNVAICRVLKIGLDMPIYNGKPVGNERLNCMLELSEQDIKSAIFEIFAAGYEAGYVAKIDIKTAYENWFNYWFKTVVLVG